jgi:hypothetical protein
VVSDDVIVASTATTPTPFSTSVRTFEGNESQEMIVRGADDDEAAKFRKCALASSKLVVRCVRFYEISLYDSCRSHLLFPSPLSLSPFF